MKVSYNKLIEYTGIDAEPHEIARILTDCGLEVEGIETYENIKGGLQGIVIGEVKNCEKHPNADKLTLTKVDIGAERLLHIVCGAPNVAAGQKVLVALEGTTLTVGENSFTIKKSKIRGETSEGMICAEDEVGLGNSHEGIMVLPAEAEIGKAASEFFKVNKDTILEIGLTPNRSDATSHIGVARDLVAAWNAMHTGQPEKQAMLKLPDIGGFAVDNHDLPIEIIIEDPKACPRYSGITVSGVKVEESPQWLKDFLKSIGVRPINNVVDITNFVMFEMGQPLHAFDTAYITGNKVVVKQLPDGSPFTTLDEVERKLTAADLMICNAEDGMCIAGVFGGIRSGVTEKTRNVFLESAYFDPVSVRKTSKHHGLKTDASFRFERGADPNITVYALKRAAMMIREIAGGFISSEVVDVYPEKILPFQVEMKYRNIDRLIGKKIDRGIINNILNWLGMKITDHSDDGFVVVVPTYKTDVQREADVIEEILRIYGYNNIEFDLSLRSSISISEKPNRLKLRNTVSDFLVSNGFYEIMCNSLTKSIHDKALPFINSKKHVRILNPISRDLDAMRQTLLLGGLETVVFNLNRKVTDMKLFEFGAEYTLNPEKAGSENQLEKYREHWKLALFTSGLRHPESWRSKEEKTDFFQIWAMVHALLERIGLDGSHFKMSETNAPWFDFGLQLMAGEKVLADFGKLTKKVVEYFDIRQEVFYAEIDWELCLALLARHPGMLYKEIPRYPEVRRDLALLLDKNINFAEIEALALQNGGKLLRNVSLFDVYEGEQVGSDKKSYAVSFILRDDNKTLKDEEIDAFMNRLINVFKKKLQAQLR
ncbi:MAG TPA: phenylalanine--tRNA ligase subunit beta [Bacteroidales bacterium]|nr:phenylalanine--tRNA ligase subunit beta [Bacteroidales bacterium]